MKTKNHYAILAGHLETVTPFATSPPEDSRAKGAAPLPRMPVFLADEMHHVPYVPGGGICGRLRRVAADCVKAAAPGAFPMEAKDYFYNVVGGVKGDEKEDKGDIGSMAERRARNPLISLFGAGAPWTMGRLAVGHAIPSGPFETTKIVGVRSDDIARRPEALDLLTPRGQEDYFQYATANQARTVAEREMERLSRQSASVAKTGDKAEADRLSAAAAEREDARKACLERMAVISSNSLLMPLAGYEAIPAGVRPRRRR